MTKYINVKGNISDGQKEKLQHAPPAGRGVEFAGCRPAEW